MSIFRGKLAEVLKPEVPEVKVNGSKAVILDAKDGEVSKPREVELPKEIFS